MLPGGLVIPFGPSTAPFAGPHASAFPRPPPYAVMPPFSHGLFVPQMAPPPSPNMNSGKPVQHKIHELTSAASSPPSATSGKASTTTATLSSSKGGGDVVMSSSVIPPVQRHLHMHQHTHSFPLFPSPGLDYAANTYAATMFGHNGTPINLAYPPK
uniref:Uncharacterized protein n=1 Tax=Plectus sambesii TaxID=2011161 RepID=A0A914VHB0_9BILA